MSWHLILTFSSFKLSAGISIAAPEGGLTQEFSLTCSANSTIARCSWIQHLALDSNAAGTVSCCYGDLCSAPLPAACPGHAQLRVETQGSLCTLILPNSKETDTSKVAALWRCETEVGASKDVNSANQELYIQKAPKLEVLKLVALVILLVFITSLLGSIYLIFNHRPRRPETLQFKYFGTRCEVSWVTPPEIQEFQPFKLESYLPIKNYVIQKREDEGVWKKVGTRTNGQPQKYVVEGLTVGTEVEFIIIAVNIVGRQSEPSEPSPAYTVIDKPTPPGVPLVEVEEVILDDGRTCIRNSCMLTWTPPDSSQGSAVTNYTIYKTENWCDWKTIGTTNGSLSFKVDGLVAGAQLQFNVIATNIVGDSRPSETSPMYFVIDRPSQPKKPRVQESNSTSCTLQWGAPENDGGCEITEYIIQNRQNHGDWKFFTQFKPKAEKALALKISGLDTGARVTFRTIAVNRIGESFPSAPSPLCALELADDPEAEKDKISSGSHSPSVSGEARRPSQPVNSRPRSFRATE